MIGSWCSHILEQNKTHDFFFQGFFGQLSSVSYETVMRLSKVSYETVVDSVEISDEQIQNKRVNCNGFGSVTLTAH